MGKPQLGTLLCPSSDALPPSFSERIVSWLGRHYQSSLVVLLLNAVRQWGNLHESSARIHIHPSKAKIILKDRSSHLNICREGLLSSPLTEKMRMTKLAARCHLGGQVTEESGVSSILNSPSHRAQEAAPSEKPHQEPARATWLRGRMPTLCSSGLPTSPHPGKECEEAGWGPLSLPLSLSSFSLASFSSSKVTTNNHPALSSSPFS